ncbi:hypothetical protein BSKO_01577 [Bryopsis sp. KO-2023]|nr:hypothetical protein BSKO_01577 [Bryopsis sp. KO-2023]
MPGDEGPSCQQLRENEQGKGVGGSEELESDDDSKLPCLGKLKEELTCSICLDICVRPSTTPCGHNFCRRCLRGALQYSMKCPKCREMLPPGFPMNINTVLWNTIQLLFPTVCSAPASPPAQAPAAHRISDLLGSEQLEAELEVLQLEGDSLAMDGYESLDFLLSRLDIADPYGRHGAPPQPQNGMPFNPVQGSPRVQPNHRGLNMFEWDVDAEHQARRPTYRELLLYGSQSPDMYSSARSLGRRWQPRYTHSRGGNPRPSFMDSAPLYPANGIYVPDRRHPLRARQEPSASSAHEGALSPGSSVESGHETRPSRFNRSNSFAEWRSGGPPLGPPPMHSHNAPHRNIFSPFHRFRNPEPHDSPRDSFGSPLSVSPNSAVHNGELDAHRYFDEEEWLELATESEHLDTPRARSPNYPPGPLPPLPRIEIVGSYVGAEDRENVGRNGVEERETIDLAEYQLIEGIDGPRIIPRRHRGEEGMMRASGPSSPARDLSPRSQADIQRLLLMRPVEHASYHDWPPSLDRDREYLMSLLHDGGGRGGGEGNGSMPSGRGGHRENRGVREPRYGSVLGGADLGEGSVGSDDSSIDLDATMNEVEGLLPYLAQPDSTGYSSWRRRNGYPHRPNQRAQRGQQSTRRSGVARDMLSVRENGRENLARVSSSNRAMARETLDQLRGDRSRRYSPYMGGIELAHPDDSSQVSEVEISHSPTRLEEEISERLGGTARSDGRESPSRDLLDSDQGGSLDMYENFQHREDEGQMLAELHHPRALRHQEVELNAPRRSYVPMSDIRPASVSSIEEFFDCGVDAPRSAVGGSSFDEISLDRHVDNFRAGEGTSSSHPRNESNRTVVVHPESSSEDEIEEQDDRMYDRGPQTPFSRFVSTFRRHQGPKEEYGGCSRR